MYQLIGLDENNEQIYECRSDSKETEELAKDILDKMEHVYKVIAIENVPNVSQIDDSYMISHRCRFRFMLCREDLP